MGSDLSTIDAELEALGTGAAPEDVWALAEAYAPDVVGAQRASLAEVDRALTELAEGVQVAPSHAGDVTEFEAPREVVHASDAHDPVNGWRRSEPLETSPASDPSELAKGRFSVRGSGPLESEEIALPEPVTREPLELDETSREIPLELPAPRSGSFTVASETEPPPALASEHTLEIIDEDELAEDERDELESEALESEDTALARAPQAENRRSQFDTERPVRERIAIEIEDGDREFDELFADASSHGALPGREDASQVSRLEGDYTPGDDTDIFDSSVLGIAEPEEPLEDAFMEELDSSEFDVVPEAKVTPPAAPARPSKPPEKRPSFIGRLFGRKEDGPQS